MGPAGLCLPSELSPLFQALAGEVGMSSELDDVAQALFNGQIPGIWRRLAPDTLKTLGNWIIFFRARYEQYTTWVSKCLQTRICFGNLHHVLCRLGQKPVNTSGRFLKCCQNCFRVDAGQPQASSSPRAVEAECQALPIPVCGCRSARVSLK